eukprot:scaffold2165_cov294-Pinguiococcus_pyrenoidosus.AAC.5
MPRRENIPSTSTGAFSSWIPRALPGAAAPVIPGIVTSPALGAPAPRAGTLGVGAAERSGVNVKFRSDAAPNGSEAGTEKTSDALDAPEVSVPFPAGAVGGEATDASTSIEASDCSAAAARSPAPRRRSSIRTHACRRFSDILAM